MVTAADLRELRQGARVLVKGQGGSVVYVRMAAPDYSKIGAVSVRLDAKSGDPKYAGTIFPAEDVVPNDLRSEMFS